MTIKPNRKTYRDIVFTGHMILLSICVFLLWFLNKERYADWNIILLVTASFVFICIFFYSRKGEVYIPDAKQVLDRKKIYMIDYHFYWYEDWGTPSGRYIGKVYEIWPNRKDDYPKLVSFINTPPAEGMFIMVEDNSIKISKEDYTKIQSCQQTINDFLAKY